MFKNNSKTLKILFILSIISLLFAGGYLHSKKIVADKIINIAKSSNFSLEKEYKKFLQAQDQFYAKLMTMDNIEEKKEIIAFAEKTIQTFDGVDYNFKIFLDKKEEELSLDEKVYVLNANRVLEEINVFLDKEIEKQG